MPAHKTFEWGYKRGNPKHNREEYLSQKDHTFKAKVDIKQHNHCHKHGIMGRRFPDGGLLRYRK